MSSQVNNCFEAVKSPILLNTQKQPTLQPSNTETMVLSGEIEKNGQFPYFRGPGDLACPTQIKHGPCITQTAGSSINPGGGHIFFYVFFYLELKHKKKEQNLRKKDARSQTGPSTGLNPGRDEIFWDHNLFEIGGKSTAKLTKLKKNNKTVARAQASIKEGRLSIFFLFGVGKHRRNEQN